MTRFARGLRLNVRPLDSPRWLTKRHAKFVCWLAPIWTVAAAVYLLFGPTYTTIHESVAVGLDRTNVRSGVISSSQSRFERQGRAAVVPLVIPVMVSVLPLFGRSSRGRRLRSLAAAVILAMFCSLLIVSIGIFYVPSVIALIFQAWQQKRLPSRSAV